MQRHQTIRQEENVHATQAVPHKQQTDGEHQRVLGQDPRENQELQHEDSTFPAESRPVASGSPQP